MKRKYRLSKALTLPEKGGVLKVKNFDDKFKIKNLQNGNGVIVPKYDSDLIFIMNSFDLLYPFDGLSKYFELKSGRKVQYSFQDGEYFYFIFGPKKGEN